MMKSCVIKSAMLVLVLFSISPVNTFAAGESTNYKVGERLPKKTAIVASSTYKPLNWDELMPADWDPMKPFKGLDFDNMKDSDPRAMEAMEKVRDAWNSAPVVPALNGSHVKIPGFVVPLDIDRHKIKEFLLVPYFGACIHVPPPPGNQVIHILTTKTLTNEQNEMLKKALLIQGPVFVSGVLATESSNTDMGFAGYSMKADIIEPYKAPEAK